ncbi:Glycosyltransferase involved in cell wall bisynthesis [Asanoa hainanensis]|uniref:Glycosyltransferase involved in cell wall bisynthesis n=1 Tax=Asanoa hainanensis TaxID=560556 RepID=A0A239GU42_9ACTN|nr:glycosyltransferase family 4 protein [Asanoa hainanensis]SNS72362.1 Glycosyltransferase involved in cell wall bisynthesis [Asanoa hainanensis]
MRVLLLSPFAPHLDHDHAAADTVVKLVPRLAAKTELFVYSPQVRAFTERDGYTLLPGAAPAGRFTDRLGVRPGWLRQAWPRQATVDVAELVDRIRPDVVHAEYLQTAEIVGRLPRTVLGLHDITAAVMAESVRAATGPARAYRLAELVRTRRFERDAIRRADAVVTLSPADRDVVAAENPRVVLAPPGIDLPAEPWRPPAPRTPPRLVFCGALWRRANALVAQHLVTKVMPLVWRTHPAAELRIVGARPGPEVTSLAGSRVVVAGTVPDLAAELRTAHAALLPSILGGGVLLKVLHAMALGMPVVTSPGPAAAVGGPLEVGATPEELAAAVARVLTDPAGAAARGAAGREHVAARFRWEDTVAGYLDAYATAAAR